MPDQQIIKGTVYSDGNAVNATNLNEHVDNARLAFGAITAQPAAASVALTDELLINQSSSLKKATLTQVQAAIASDYLKKDGSVNMTTGQLNLYSTAQLADLNAVSLGHLNANFVKNSGSQIMSGSLAFGTSQLVKLDTTGISMLTTEQLVTLSRDPLTALEAVPKQYVDNLLNPQQLKCRAYFSSVTSLTPVSNTLNTSNYKTLPATRTVNTNILTINFNNLSSNYTNASSPFFLKGQFIGLVAASGVTGHLYEIQTVDNTNKNFTIITPETTAYSGTVQLSCIYDNSNNTATDSYNCKSIYLDESCNKYYVNYWNDVVTKSKVNDSPTRIYNSVVTGQGYTNVANQLVAKEMTYMFLRTNVFAQDSGEGFGACTTGFHLGLFYAYANGQDEKYVYQASFAIF